MKSKDIWGEGCQQEMGRLCTFKPAVAEKSPQATVCRGRNLQRVSEA